MWEQLWTTPQAVIWERHRLHYEVALYVRKFIEASNPKSSASLATAVRQIADSLGLTVPGLLRNRWRIGASEEPIVGRNATRSGSSSRQRFRVLDGGVAAEPTPALPTRTPRLQEDRHE